MSSKSKIKVAVVGVGNCCSSLVQCIQYSKDKKEKDIVGLMHYDLGGYLVSDIDVVCAFDVDRRKVGKSLSRAIFSEPNCTKKIWNEYSFDNVVNDVIVCKVCPFDGVAKHMEDQFLIDNRQAELNFDQIVEMLKNNKVDVLINYLPVGTQIGTDYWTDIALSARCAFINCIPIFVASNIGIAQKFKSAGLPVIGDDVKSQAGATILHRAIINMLVSRGVKIDSTWQTNVGGNTDFKNMLLEARLSSKRISKTESVSCLVPDNTPVYAGPNGFIESLKDNKICNIRVDFRILGDVPCSIDCKLSVEDSPDSAGVVIDCIRLAKIALDRGVGGPIMSACSYYMKHPPVQISDEDARRQLEDFIDNKI